MVKLIECTKRFRKRIAVDHLSATLDTGIIGYLVLTVQEKRPSCAASAECTS